MNYKNLKFNLEKGLKITKIHKGVKFEESNEYAEYINMNTEVRAEAKKNLYKLMNNAVYGKTLENVRERINFRLTTTPEQFRRLAKKPTYQDCVIFSENLVGVHMRKGRVTLDKPILVGVTILENSKLTMYDFHYNYAKPKWGENLKLCFTDTDSLFYEIKTDEINTEDLKDDSDERFDTSNNPTDHHSGLPSGINKKVLEMMKDEKAREIIVEFVGLRPKSYSILMGNGKTERKCKGVKHSESKLIKHDEYLDCLFGGEERMCDFNIFKSEKHDIYSVNIKKVALSANGDKRHILPNSVETLSFGHRRIVK